MTKEDQIKAIMGQFVDQPVDDALLNGIRDKFVEFGATDVLVAKETDGDVSAHIVVDGQDYVVKLSEAITIDLPKITGVETVLPFTSEGGAHDQ